MAYEDIIQRDTPSYFYNMNGAATQRATLVSGGGSSARLSTTTNTYTLPVFDRKYQSYALEVWFKVFGPEKILVLGHAEQDGLKYEAGTISYDVKLSDETVTLTHTPDQSSTFHVVVSYNYDTVVMYVNGARVDQYSFTEPQRDKPYGTFAAPDTLTTNTFGAMLVIDAVAFYSQMPEDMPFRHYQWGQAQPDIIRNAAILSGSSLELHIDNILSSEVALLWDQGRFTDTNSAENFLSQDIDQDGLAVASSWQYALFVDEEQNVIVDWTGEGKFVVESSIDEVTWTTIIRGGHVTLPTAFNNFLYIRVTFPAGRLSKVNSMRATKYANQQLGAWGNTRTVSISNQGVLSQYFYPIENKDIGVDGVVSVSGGDAVAAVEFWIKAPNVTSITNLTGTQTINNGAGFFPNEWNHVVVVGNNTTSFTVGKSSSIIGMINLYATAPVIDTLYKSYYGINSYRVEDGTANAISDDFKQYSYQWTTIISS